MSASLMVKEFKEWRKRERLPFNPNFLPKAFELVSGARARVLAQ